MLDGDGGFSLKWTIKWTATYLYCALLSSSTWIPLYSHGWVGGSQPFGQQFRTEFETLPLVLLILESLPHPHPPLPPLSTWSSCRRPCSLQNLLALGCSPVPSDCACFAFWQLYVWSWFVRTLTHLLLGLGLPMPFPSINSVPWFPNQWFGGPHLLEALESVESSLYNNDSLDVLLTLFFINF